MNVAIEIGLKSVGLTLLCAIVAWMFRGQSAAVRHRVWALGFLGLAALPLLSLQLPTLKIERPTYSHRQIVAPITTPLPPVAAKWSNVSELKPPPPPEPYSPPLLPFVLITVWGFGALLLIGKTFGELLIAKSWLKSGSDLSMGVEFGLPPHTRLIRSTVFKSPMTIGFLRPTVFLPEDSQNWNPERMRAVLLHEGAHVQRGDWAWLVFARFLCALYWPNPLVWYAAMRLRAEGELAADDAVLLSGVDSPSYAQTLVDLAEGLQSRSLGIAMPFVESGTLKSRITAILKTASKRGPVKRPLTIAALLTCSLAVAAYASTHFVKGALRIQDGFLELGDGRTAEVVAITEIRNGKAVSWDVHGALLRRSFSLGQQDLQAFSVLKPVPAGSTARYVVFRINDDNYTFPIFRTESGEDLVAQFYNGDALQFGTRFTDALGASYRVVRVVEPIGSKTGSITANLPEGPWKLYAYKTFDKGRDENLLNPGAGLELSPSPKAYGGGSTASFVLPASFSDQESMVRFLPNRQEASYFDGVTGPEKASCSAPLEAITGVEILSRPIQPVAIQIPFEPNPSETYSPRHFLPQSLETADQGNVRLTDGTEFGIGAIDYFKSSPSGPLMAAGTPAEWTRGEMSILTPQMLYQIKPSDRSTCIWTYRDPRNSSGNPGLMYDSEGWPLAQSRMQVEDRTGTSSAYFPQVEGEAGKMDLVTSVATGELKPVIRLRPGVDKRTSREFQPRKDWAGCLRVEYPDNFVDENGKQEFDFRVLDAAGKVVESRGNPTKSFAAGYVEFNLSKADANRVVYFEILSRPFTWVRFPHVAVKPNG